MINYLDIATETDSELVVLDNQQVILETNAESDAIEYIDKISLIMRGFTSWYYSSN